MLEVLGYFSLSVNFGPGEDWLLEKVLVYGKLVGIPYLFS